MILFYFFSYFIGSYFAPVVIAFCAVRYFGRPFHESDAIAMLVPYAAYFVSWSNDDGNNWNIPSATLITGLAVALCMPLRLIDSMKPWTWAAITSTIGSAVAYIAYTTVGSTGDLRPPI